MSYAIVRNEKLTRAEINGKCTHNDRKAKNHTNKDIDPTKIHLNYYLKKNTSTYTKEFDKLREERKLAGHIRENSIVMCQMIFTSDQEFFDRIGENETKRYFDECYKFICNYKNLSEENIISAVVHLDEGAPHLHLMFVPVVHTKDKDGKNIDKICARDFWKGRDSYRKLQDAYFTHVKNKGFDLENIKLELPEVPELKDIKKLVFNRDEKIAKEIIKPKDELIKNLYNENVSLHKELSKQANTVEIATKYESEYSELLEQNANLKLSNRNLKIELKEKEREFEIKYDSKISDIEQKYKKEIKELNRENKTLNKMIDKFKSTLKKFIKWLCHKFSYPSEDDLIRDFNKETYTNLNIEKGLDIKHFEKKEKDFELEL